MGTTTDDTRVDTDDERQNFVVSNDDVTVLKNSKTAEFKDIVVGDSVSLTLTYRKVTKVVATSRTTSANGKIRRC